MMDKNETEKRIAAFRATAFTDGAENTYGLWVLLQENAKAEKNFPGAIYVRELLGISEDAMEQNYGKYWRKRFTACNCGFINRQWKGCTFISVQTGDENDCNVPCDEYIISRGDVEVEAIQLFMEKIITSSKEDEGASAEAGAGGIDEDAVDTEENNVTIGGIDGKLLRNVYDYFSLQDIRSTFAGVNNMWRQTAKDARPSPDDYVTALEEGKIPCVIEFLGQQEEPVSSLEFIFTLVRQNTNIQNAISDVRVQQRVAAARQEVVDAPTIENCTRLLNCALDECEAKGKPLPLALQSMTRRILLLAQQQQLNEESNVDDNEEEQPRRKQQKGGFSTPSTQSTEAAESFEAFDIETYGGAEYIKVHAGEGVILKEYEDIWRMLSTSYIPPQWSEPFQSSTAISQEKKRKITSGAELNLN